MIETKVRIETREHSDDQISFGATERGGTTDDSWTVRDSLASNISQCLASEYDDARAVLILARGLELLAEWTGGEEIHPTVDALFEAAGKALEHAETGDAT